MSEHSQDAVLAARLDNLERKVDEGRKEQRDDHAAVRRDLANLTREVHDGNAANREALRIATEARETADATAGIVSTHLLAHAEERGRADGQASERKRWLSVPMRLLDEAPKLLLLVGATAILGAGVAIGTALELVK